MRDLRSDKQLTSKGEENPGFWNDNMDVLSHHTGSTEICEASQADYIAKVRLKF